MKRPTGVTVVSWLLIVFGFLTLAMAIFAFSKDPTGMDTALVRAARSPKTLGFQKAFAFAGVAVAIACGILMLNGARLGRSLYVFWNMLGLAVSFAVLKPEAYLIAVIPGVIPFVIFVAVLFNRKSRRFFLSTSLPAQPKKPRSARLRWSIAGLVALLGVGGAVLFLISNGTIGGSAVKSRLLASFGASRLEVNGYFFRTGEKSKKLLLGVVVKVPEERWVPTEKEFQEMTLKGDDKSDWAKWIRRLPRTNVRLFKSSRFTLIRPGDQKFRANGFCLSRFNSTVLILPVEVRVAFEQRPEDGQVTVLSDASGPVSGDVTQPARRPANGITLVMPFWEVDSDEVPSPLYIQFDGDVPVRVPNMVVAPATEGDSGPIRTMSTMETQRWTETGGWQTKRIEWARMPDSAPKSQ